MPPTFYHLRGYQWQRSQRLLHRFNGGKFTGYHNIFADVKKRALKTLIIDLRGNMGGETSWASSIFSFLIDTPTYFYRLPSEVTQQRVLYNNFKVSNWVKSVSKLKHPYPIVTPDTNIFKGKIYVLINGGSFSATSLLAANIHNLNNATFVGEETGGSKNIWTAGIIKHITLPATKLLLSYGVVPAYFGDISRIDGRGIMPDIPITYKIEDYLAEKDLELEWVMQDGPISTFDPPPDMKQNVLFCAIEAASKTAKTKNPL